MKITIEKLTEWGAYSDEKACFLQQKETDAEKLIEKLVSPKAQKKILDEYEEDSLLWANRFIVRVLDLEGQVQYAIYAAEKVLPIFEKIFPNNLRPRAAIAAARAACISHDVHAAHAADLAADAIFGAGIVQAGDDTAASGASVDKTIDYLIAIENEQTYEEQVSSLDTTIAALAANAIYAAVRAVTCAIRSTITHNSSEFSSVDYGSALGANLAANYAACAAQSAAHASATYAADLIDTIQFGLKLLRKEK
jgi:hypothetical protein